MPEMCHYDETFRAQAEIELCNPFIKGVLIMMQRWGADKEMILKAWEES